MFPYPRELKKLKESNNSEETEPLINRSLRTENKPRTASIYNLRSRNVPRSTIINRTIQKPPIKPKPIALRYLGIKPSPKPYLLDKSKLVNTVNSKDININYTKTVSNTSHPVPNIFSGCYSNWQQNQQKDERLAAVSEKIVNNIIEDAVKSHKLDKILEESDERETSSESESESDTSPVNNLTLKEELEQHTSNSEIPEERKEESETEIENTKNNEKIEEKDESKNNINEIEKDNDSKENSDSENKQEDGSAPQEDKAENKEEVKTWWEWLWGY